MTRVAAVVAVVVLLLLGPLTGASPAAEPAPDGAGGLRLDLAGLAPQVVTAAGPSVLTVTGTLTNDGEVPVSGLGVRLQRGEPLRTEGAVRDALGGDAPTDAIAPQFQELPDVLAPGEQAPVRLTVPLRGAPETGLALSGTGVYELLVNVNGVPGDGDRARLAAVRLLLPVTGLPAGPDGSEPVPAPDGVPVPVTLLYPVADQPRRLTTVPGEPVLLTDDDLAASFAPDGRLGGLVTALAGAPATARDAACVAVDPDLVQTADAMRGGYEVVGPDGTRVPGTGAAAAGAWLDALAAAVSGRCVLALPFADADLVALTRGGLTGPLVEAVDAGRGVVAGLLGTPVLPGTAWPADGLLDEATLGALGTAGVRSVVLSADGVDLPARADPGGVVPLATGDDGPSAVLADPLLAAAAGAGIDAEEARPAGTAATARPATGPLATQDLLGALAFRAAAGTGPLLVTPPHRWDVDAAAATALLEGVDALVGTGLLTPRDLEGTVAGGAAEQARVRSLVYPLDAGAAEVAPTAVASVRTVLGDLDDLRSSAVDDEQGVDPDDLFPALRLGTLRATSAAWRDEPDLAAAAAAAAAQRVADIRASVSVLEPPSPFSLGTSDSPLLLTVANGLPVTMRVRVELASTSGLRVAPIPVVEVPPLGRRQIQTSAEVLRSGVFTVDAAVLTQDGGRLGPPSRLQVRSTAYGTITLWLTGTAGVLLVVLAGRRILRRVRAEPDRATGDPATGRPPTTPSPSPQAGPESLLTTVPVRLPPPSSGPIRPGHPTGPSPRGPSAPASAAGVPPTGTPTGRPTDPTAPLRRPESP
ncbi:MAG: DUF6049 family protein [Pseudonocardiales bacterium]|nr:DUF6049 family protein [Pseudonocardiales bacterium]